MRDLAGHLVQPMFVSFRRFFVASLRYRGNTDATVAHFARQLAAKEPAQLVSLLREHADDRVDPPRVGPMGPFADTCIHLRDLARPLGLAADVPTQHWVALLEYLTNPQAPPGLVEVGRLEGIEVRATDADFAAGVGPVAAGPVEALAMAISGRSVAAAELLGPGAQTLCDRLAR